MSTNPGPTTTYRHNICGSMAERHDSGPGIIRCGDVPQSTKSDKVENILEQLYSLSEPQLHQFIHLVSAAQLLGDLPQFEAVHHSAQKSNEQA